MILLYFLWLWAESKGEIRRKKSTITTPVGYFLFVTVPTEHGYVFFPWTYVVTTKHCDQLRKVQTRTRFKSIFKRLTRRSREKYLGDYRTHLLSEDTCRLHIVKGFCLI